MSLVLKDILCYVDVIRDWPESFVRESLWNHYNEKCVQGRCPPTFKRVFLPTDALRRGNVLHEGLVPLWGEASFSSELLVERRLEVAAKVLPHELVETLGAACMKRVRLQSSNEALFDAQNVWRARRRSPR